jgi:O-antigen ligase
LAKESLSFEVILFLVFLISFENIKIFNIDFLFSKVALILVLFSSSINIKAFRSLNKIKELSIPLLMYFTLFTICNYINRTSISNDYIDLLFCLNILAFLIMVSVALITPQFMLKALFVFVVSNILVCFFFFFGIGLSEATEGRFSMFNMNENYLGINLAISFLIIISLIFENKLQLSIKRFFLILTLPFLFFLIVKTGSRVAFLSIFFGVFIFILLNKSLNIIQKIFFFIISFISSIILFLVFLKNTFMLERLMDVIESGDTSNRDLIWDALLFYFTDNSLFGIGRTGFVSIVGEMSPHNVLLEIFIYTGLVGVIIFCFFYFFIIRKAVQRIKFEDNVLPFILLIPISFLFFSGQIFDKKIVWVILSYIAGYFIYRKDNNMKIIG